MTSWLPLLSLVVAVIGGWAVNQLMTAESVAEALVRRVPRLQRHPKRVITASVIAFALATYVAGSVLLPQPSGPQQVAAAATPEDQAGVGPEDPLPSLVAQCHPSPSNVVSLALDPQGTRAFAGTATDGVLVYTVSDTCAPVEPIDADQGRITAIAATADTLYTGGENGSIVVWRQVAGKWTELHRIDDSDAPVTALLHGPRGLFAADGFGWVFRYDADTLEPLLFGSGAGARARIGHQAAVLDLAADISNPGSHILYIALSDGTLWEINTERATHNSVTGLGGVATGVAAVRDGRIILVGRAEAQVWNIGGRRPDPGLAVPLPKDREVLRVRSSADGRIVALGDATGASVLWDVETNGTFDLVIHRDSPVMAIALSADGRVMASAVAGQISFLHNVVPGKKRD